MRFIRSIRLDGFLSFAPDTPAFELRDLNVLIGPNGAGKTNLIEAFELLASTPSDFAARLRAGGGPQFWKWKGLELPTDPATIEIVAEKQLGSPPLKYLLSFDSLDNRLEIVDESIDRVGGDEHAIPYYRTEEDSSIIGERGWPGPTDAGGDGRKTIARRVSRESIRKDQSILAQRKEPDRLPELTRLGDLFESIRSFRDWQFGLRSPLRQPQPTDLPDHYLLPDGSNLALVVNRLEQLGDSRISDALKRFLPSFDRLSTGLAGNTARITVRESGLPIPLPATRLSDGTLRFVAMLAAIHSPERPKVLCIDEPELGLHPDAVALLSDLIVESSRSIQFVIATHSDTFVSGMTNVPEAVVVCERHGEGTTLERLDPRRISHWLEKYRLGDLWQMGELGGNL